MHRGVKHENWPRFNAIFSKAGNRPDDVEWLGEGTKNACFQLYNPLTILKMGLLDIIRKRKPEPTKKPQDNYAKLASPAEFTTACLLMTDDEMTDFPLPPSERDEFRRTANKLAVSIYRNIYSQQQIGPSPEMPDALILDIYRQVGCAFRAAGKERGEFVESAVINTIVLKFLEVYRTAGAKFFEDHLQYEIQKYKREGLRPDYSQKRMDLFG